MFIRAIRLDGAPRDDYPFALPAVRFLAEHGELRLPTPVKTSIRGFVYDVTGKLREVR